MRLSRLGSLHQSRLSFMRQLTRRMAAEAWHISRPVFEIDDQGVGRAVYQVKGPERVYSLVAFAHDLPEEQRSDRVIADAWDATFTLFDGVPGEEDLQRLAANVPLQEAGRVSERELSLARANRSVRLWEHVVSRLAVGAQPDAEQIDAVGYLMRTTAVYGSGKFGAADREVVQNRTEFAAPFQVEMLTVYLIRCFVRDLVEHMAQKRGQGQAAKLAPDMARRLGIGNSTGLGMAPFIVNHPVLFSNWIAAREEAISRVRAEEQASVEVQTMFLDLLKKAEPVVSGSSSSHPKQIEKTEDLQRDLSLLRGHLQHKPLERAYPWDALLRWASQTLSEEGQEFLHSLVLEPYGALVDTLAAEMSDDNRAAFSIDGAMPVSELRTLLQRSFGWAFDLDWSDAQACARAWYVSEEKLEPRLGERFDEPIEHYEQPLAPARDATRAYEDLRSWDESARIADFLRSHPEHRHVVRRAQISRIAPYGEIRDNTIAADLMPIDMLRAKLSFFGATRFDPRSDRWVRICMYAGAPYPEDLSVETADYWVYPEVAS